MSRVAETPAPYVTGLSDADIVRIVRSTPCLLDVLVAMEHKHSLPSAASPALVMQLITSMGTLKHEQFVVLVLTSPLKVKARQVMSVGSDDACATSVPSILQYVLREGGSRFIVAHNHPSSPPIPSEEDKTLTAALRGGAKACGINLLDHVIVAGGDWFSFSMAGWPGAYA